MEKCEYEEVINRMKELEKSEPKKTQKDYIASTRYLYCVETFNTFGGTLTCSINATASPETCRKSTLALYVPC